MQREVRTSTIGTSLVDLVDPSGRTDTERAVLVVGDDLVVRARPLSQGQLPITAGTEEPAGAADDPALD